MRRLFLLYISYFIFSSAGAQCLVEGTTSDGIVIADVKMDKAFKQLANTKSIQIQNENSRATSSFTITVPAGKVASLSYKLFLEIYTSKSGGKIPRQSSLSFTVRCDGNLATYHSDPVSVIAQADRVEITEGKHYIEFETHFSAKKCKIAGSIDNLSIHVHQFGKMQVSREPICGQEGENYSTCDVCGKDSTIAIAPKYNEHSLVVRSTTEASCMSNAGSLSVCERCPYAEINYTYDVNEHNFDADGICRVCHMRMPKTNADGTVYDINYASEMHVLSELVALGRIPGNIGININSDLVFDKDTTMVPLGTFDNPFQGVLNGHGHRIRGIVFSYQGFNCLGFVGVAKGTLLKNAVIANLIFDSGNTLRGKTCVGGIVGYASSCDIVNCASFGALEGTDNVGGIVGYADRQVSIHNCGSVASIRAYGQWNTMVCGMPLGQIMNSYGASTNVLDGPQDVLPTTTLRHCFSTQGSAPGLTRVSQDVLTSYAMVQLLNEESESPSFEKSQDDHYPVPVVNTAIQAKANSAIPTPQKAYAWRAAAAPSDVADNFEDEGEDNEVASGYVDENSPTALGRTIQDVLHEDSVQYADFERLYIVTRSAPEGFKVYDEISGGRLLAFESYLQPADSSYLKMTEYEVLSSGKMKATTETMCVYTGDKKRIDEYTVGRDGTPSLTSRINFDNEYDIVYQESVDGVLKPVWSIETKYDETTGNASVTNGYSFDRITGETHLEFSSTYDSDDTEDDLLSTDNYEEYVDYSTYEIHVLYYYLDPVDEKTLCREHYILRASDQYLLEIRFEKMINGNPLITDGLYFVYDYEDELLQSVAFGPADRNSPGRNLRPYRYYEYYGYWQGTSFPTAIKVPTVEQPSLRDRIDSNVYDMQGRVVRKVTDVGDPFSGLPRGLYIYQGTKYLKRN